MLSVNRINRAITAASLIGVTFNLSGRTNQACIWRTDTGGSFEGYYEYERSATKAVREEFPDDEVLHKIVDELDAMQLQHGCNLEADAYHHGSRPIMRHGTMMVDVTVPDGTISFKRIEAEQTVRGCLRRFADWIVAREKSQELPLVG